MLPSLASLSIHMLAISKVLLFLSSTCLFPLSPTPHSIILITSEGREHQVFRNQPLRLKKKKKKLLYLEQEGCFGNPLLWVECEYSVTESPIGNTSSRWRKISPILLGSDIWHTSGLPSIVFNYDLACRAMLSLFIFFHNPPFSPLSDQLHSGQVSCSANRLAHPPLSIFLAVLLELSA